MVKENQIQCENKLAQSLYDKLDQFIKSMNFTKNDPRRKGNLITVLHHAQHLFGYLPEEVQIHVAKKLNMHHSEISGVISFYNFFTTKPKGKYSVNVCMGTACFVKGADKILEEFEKRLCIKSGQVSIDGKFSIDVVRCIGACGLAPVVVIGEKVFGRVKLEDVQNIIAEYQGKD